VDIAFDGTAPISLTVFGATWLYSQQKKTFKSVEIVFNMATKLINVTIFEDRCDVSVPLHLQFQWKLRYGGDEELPEIDIHETFTGPEVTINAETIERFCAVVGNEDSSFQLARNSEVKAPIHFEIVAGWQVSGNSVFILSLTNAIS
jgi:fatty acid synthase subunit alpha, fungi type